jgi:hypothetical protein
MAPIQNNQDKSNHGFAPISTDQIDLPSFKSVMIRANPWFDLSLSVQIGVKPLVATPA